MKVIACLIVAFMGLVTCLAGFILFFQERVTPLPFGGFKVEHPYWQIGYILIVFGLIVIVCGAILMIFIPIERKMREWAKKD